VTDRGLPIVGLTVSLGSGGGTIDEVTDAQGYAQFSDLFPGSLRLTTQYGGDWTDFVFVDVSDSGPQNALVQLSWPGRKPIAVRTVQGILRGPNYYPTLEQKSISLSLVDARSRRAIETIASDEKGRFRFNAAVPPGIYFIQLSLADKNESSDEVGTISIELNSAANLDGLDLDFVWTDCGLEYAQRHAQGELKVGKICGDVADTSGGVIEKAQVALLDGDDELKIVTRSLSGPMGQFTIPDTSDGVYELVVSSLGFQPFVRRVRLVSDHTEGCTKPMRIRLDGL